MKTPIEMKSPIVKLTRSTVSLTNGVNFKVIHNISDADFDFCLQRWANTTRNFADENFCQFVHHFIPVCICVTESQYEKITKGKVEPTTEEEYLKQFN